MLGIEVEALAADVGGACHHMPRLVHGETVQARPRGGRQVGGQGKRSTSTMPIQREAGRWRKDVMPLANAGRAMRRTPASVPSRDCLAYSR